MLKTCTVVYSLILIVLHVCIYKNTNKLSENFVLLLQALLSLIGITIIICRHKILLGVSMKSHLAYLATLTTVKIFKTDEFH